ncbi:MAG: PIN domain-containing protein [Coriobacteriales bacterium]|jgi:predicted nucleic acid-binding protein|nr:PIN domain-containing protein [Coriobacteriales bacterium]
MAVLLDTNVLLDYFAQREPYYQQTVQLKAMSFFGDVELWATANSFTDVFYLMCKSNTSAEVQKAFLASFEYLGICSVTADDIREATSRAWDDFEDCLVAVCAEKLRAEYILTRDKTGFTASKIPAMEPAAFIDNMAATRGVSYAELRL